MTKETQGRILGGIAWGATALAGLFLAEAGLAFHDMVFCFAGMIFGGVAGAIALLVACGDIA